MFNFQGDLANSLSETICNNSLFSDPNESYDKLENVIINAKINIFNPNMFL